MSWAACEFLRCMCVSYEQLTTACYEQPQHSYKSHQDKP